MIANIREVANEKTRRKGRMFYPKEMLRGGTDVTVEAAVLIDAEGRVANAWILQSVPHFDSAALDAIKSWTFRPATSRGQPAPFVGLATVSFKVL